METGSTMYCTLTLPVEINVQYYDNNKMKLCTVIDTDVNLDIGKKANTIIVMHSKEIK